MSNNRLVLLSNNSHGSHKPEQWIKEGDGLFESAKILRRSLTRRRNDFSERIRDRRKNGHRTQAAWAALEGLPTASHLLLGYACELYLKGGLAKAYRGCEGEFFDNKCKFTFRHDLRKAAKEIDFPFEEDHKLRLKMLAKSLLTGRYPVPGTLSREDYVVQVNARSSYVWNNDEFDEITNLVKRIREHVQRVDNDPENTCIYRVVRIDEDGYAAFRRGGHLRTRITYKPSSKMIYLGQEKEEDVRNLLVEPNGFDWFRRFWNEAEIERQEWSDKPTI